MNYYSITRDNNLYHHGIKGQKWGVLRYQDKTGALTDKGRARYESDVKKSGKLVNQIRKYEKKSAKFQQKLFQKQKKGLKYSAKALKLQAKGKFDDASKFLKKQYDKNLKAAKFGAKSAKIQKKLANSRAFKANLDMSITAFKDTYGRTSK